MKSAPVKVVRIYLLEGPRPKEVMRYLREDAKVRRATLFRGVSGFGRSGTHEASLLDLSLQLPVVIEFMVRPERLGPILEHLEALVPPGHLFTWDATVNDEP